MSARARGTRLTRSHETYKVHGNAQGLCVEREEDGIKLGSGVDPTADGRLDDRYTTKKGAKMEPMF